MGARGPLPQANSRRGERRRSSTALALAPGHPERLPATPNDLGTAGREAWREAWRCEWALTTDARAIEHLARLEDERAAVLETIGSDLLLEKVLVSPKGDVVGSERYANPLLRELRRLDSPILALRAALGLSPMARARLGQAVVRIRKDERALERERIMGAYVEAVGDA
jgi:hypothetical protein